MSSTQTHPSAPPGYLWLPNTRCVVSCPPRRLLNQRCLPTSNGAMTAELLLTTRGLCLSERINTTISTAFQTPSTRSRGLLKSIFMIYMHTIIYYYEHYYPHTSRWPVTWSSDEHIHADDLAIWSSKEHIHDLYIYVYVCVLLYITKVLEDRGIQRSRVESKPSISDWVKPITLKLILVAS